MPQSSHWDEVHLTSSYPIGPGDASGHFVQAEALASAQRGNKVLVLAPFRDKKYLNLRVSDEHSNLFLYGFSSSQLFGSPGLLANLRRRPWLIFGLFGSLARLRRSPVGKRTNGQTGKLFCHWLIPGAFPLLVSLVRGKKTAIVCHGSDIALLQRMPRQLRWIILKVISRSACEFRFVSEELRAIALRWSAPVSLINSWQAAEIKPSPLIVPIFLPSAPRSEQQHFAGERLIDLAQASCLHDSSVSLAVRRLFLKQGPKQKRTRLLVVVARLIKNKRVDTAIRAALLIARTEVVVIGEGPQLKVLQKDYPDVHFVGQLNREMTLYWLAAADVLISASRREGAPTAIREALYLSTSVVATQAGDLRNWQKHEPDLLLVN